MAGIRGTDNPLRYRGYYYDVETGFYWLLSRYYDPEVGRFINRDKYLSTGQGILGYNMYAYCRNNPINRKDVDGDADMDIFDDDPRDDLFPKTDGGASNHYRVDLSQASNSSLYHGGIINNGYTAYGYTAFSSESSTESFSRVGRWMSKTEYSNMKNTGRVQMSSNGNTTYVANPADINAFGRQAKPGSIYVEFSVPSSSIYPAGVVGWGQIPGPGSLYDRLNQVKGLPPILGMPIAVDIQIEGEK